MNTVSNLDKRCYDILKRIMYAGGYLKIQELADEMQSSKRSVYYDINKINDWLQERGIEELIQERGKGIIVNHTQIKAIQDALSETSGDTNHLFTRDERVKIQICSIIIRSNPLYIEDFMESCQVSRNTIINDLKSVAQFLEIYNLTLSYDIKRGYRIVGDIIRKRALFFMLFPSLWEYYERKLIPAVDEESVQHNLHLLKQIEKELQAEYVSGILPSLALFLSSVDKRNDRLTFN
ncbi:MAG: helix-turn-helix domain-containing protein, partial [Longicatena sp.]